MDAKTQLVRRHWRRYGVQFQIARVEIERTPQDPALFENDDMGHVPGYGFEDVGGQTAKKGWRRHNREKEPSGWRSDRVCFIFFYLLHIFF